MSPPFYPPIVYPQHGGITRMGVPASRTTPSGDAFDSGLPKNLRSQPNPRALDWQLGRRRGFVRVFNTSPNCDLGSADQGAAIGLLIIPPFYAIYAGVALCLMRMRVCSPDPLSLRRHLFSHAAQHSTIKPKESQRILKALRERGIVSYGERRLRLSAAVDLPTQLADIKIKRKGAVVQLSAAQRRDVVEILETIRDDGQARFDNLAKQTAATRADLEKQFRSANKSTSGWKYRRAMEKDPRVLQARRAVKLYRWE